MTIAQTQVDTPQKPQFQGVHMSHGSNADRKAVPIFLLKAMKKSAVQALGELNNSPYDEQLSME